MKIRVIIPSYPRFQTGADVPTDAEEFEFPLPPPPHEAYYTSPQIARREIEREHLTLAPSAGNTISRTRKLGGRRTLVVIMHYAVYIYLLCISDFLLSYLVLDLFLLLVLLLVLLIVSRFCYRLSHRFQSLTFSDSIPEDLELEESTESLYTESGQLIVLSKLVVTVDKRSRKGSTNEGSTNEGSTNEGSANDGSTNEESAHSRTSSASGNQSFDDEVIEVRDCGRLEEHRHNLKTHLKTHIKTYVKNTRIYYIRVVFDLYFLYNLHI